MKLRFVFLFVSVIVFYNSFAQTLFEKRFENPHWQKNPDTTITAHIKYGQDSTILLTVQYEITLDTLNQCYGVSYCKFVRTDTNQTNTLTGFSVDPINPVLTPLDKAGNIAPCYTGIYVYCFYNGEEKQRFAIRGNKTFNPK